jgi:undecaprenyl-diphosphatase
MLKEIFLAIVQAATEFLPVSSSGHLALFSNIISKPDLFFFTILHLASLLAVIIFTRKEIYELITFKKNYRKVWVYLIIATIPAAIFGYFFNAIIEKTFNSFLFLGFAFIFTGFILLLTKANFKESTLKWWKFLIIGLFQVLALFPGISRSGLTISSALFLGIKKEKAAKFSFLLFIPLALGAVLLESEQFYINLSLIISFFITLILSILFLRLLYSIVRKGYFWVFGVYCFIIGGVSLIFYFI